MADGGRSSVLIVGVGNQLRGDDGAGIEVARRLRGRARAAGIDVEEEHDETTSLIDRWRGRRAVVVVDALHGGVPGTIHRLDASSVAVAERPTSSSSTHAVGLGQTIELARALGLLPGRVIIYAIVGRCFRAGDRFSEELAAGLPGLAERVLDEASRLSRSR